MTASACRCLEAVWESLSPVEQDIWRTYLSSKAYDATDHYLVVNEFQAYLFQQEREEVEAFQSLTLWRMKIGGAESAALARAPPGRISSFVPRLL